MQLSLRQSPKATKAIRPRSDRDHTLPALLEFQSPSAAVITMPVPRSARGVIWIITSMFAIVVTTMGLIPIDKVVTAHGKVVSKNATIVLQPLETSIVRSIHVREGQQVHAGEVIAELDPTFAAADVGSLAAQVSSLQAEVSRMQAEEDGKPFTYSGLNPDLSLQAAIYAQRQAEYNFRIENYRQKIASLYAQVERSQADANGYRGRLGVATDVEAMRKQLEKLQVGSRLNSLAATDTRLEMQRGMEYAIETENSAKRDLAAMVAERDGFVQNWKADLSQKMSEETQKLSDAREQLRKAQLRRQLVELRADRDATVLTVAKVSVGSVLQTGQEFISLVPVDAPLEVEANIAGHDDGFVHVGDPVAIKFDTFPFTQYGMAKGAVRTVSADSFTRQDDQKTPGAMPVSGPENEMFYRSRISLDEVKLHGVPAGFRLIPGMPVTADIKVGKRTVLTYLLGRVLPVAKEGMREP
jgi:hemolysin D